jgi:hypothetical protein
MREKLVNLAEYRNAPIKQVMDTFKHLYEGRPEECVGFEYKNRVSIRD